MTAPRLTHATYLRALRLFAPARACRTWLALAPVLRANRRPIVARFAVAPPFSVLGAERVPCVGCGRAIRATGKGPVTRRGDGWRCWRCCE